MSSMAADTSDASDFKILAIPADEEGCRFYLEQYKPFRLTSLRQDPDAFGSTYAREIEFNDEAWLGRIKNPSATTYVAVRLHDDRVVASTSLIGPLPNASPASNPYQILPRSERIPQSDDTAADENIVSREPLCFQMSAVYTSPEARGRGLAKALIKAAAAEARRKAQSRGKPLVLSVVVYATNSAAISLYECCGFVRDPGGPKLTFNTCKNSSSQELDMYFSGA